jgi:hypothetical protein
LGEGESLFLEKASGLEADHFSPASEEVKERLCGIVVRVSGYISRGPGFDSRRFQIF